MAPRPSSDPSPHAASSTPAPAEVFTIDPEDARDFDDAIFVHPFHPDGGGGWELAVHIADVSHYVRSGSAIDREAKKRGNTVYLADRVLPMLPEKLYNDLCSLNPGVERLCMVCDMLITAKGDIHAYQFYPAVMFSHARFTYTEVAAILQNTRGPEAAQRKGLLPYLINLHDVYGALLTARGVRGAVDFETVETQIVCDESGRIEKIVPRTRNDAHKLIEEAMLAANVCSADFIGEGKHTGLFRVHEGPTPEKQETLRNYLKAMGVSQTLSDKPHPSEYQRIAAGFIVVRVPPSWRRGEHRARFPVGAYRVFHRAVGVQVRAHQRVGARIGRDAQIEGN